MPDIDPEVEAIVLLDRSSGAREVLFVSPLCGGDSAGELWWEADSDHYVLFQQDEFYDELLRERRNSGNMISPRDPARRLVLVGSVWGTALYDSGRFVEIARARITPQWRAV